MLQGLSPRERGNPGSWMTVFPRSGLSPRERGNPIDLVALARVSTRQVYPRASGGTATSVSQATGRGLRGSIPARAGEPGVKVSGPLATGLSPRERGNPLDEILDGLSPRERGNHFAVTPTTPSISGLSPRERGNRSRGAREPESTIGSIPARAGEPPDDEAALRRLPRSIPARAGEPSSSKS